MAFVHGKGASILLNGKILSPFLSSYDQTISVETAETTTFGSSEKNYVAGLRDGTVSLSGYFDGAAGAIDATFSSALGDSTAAVLSIADEGITVTGNRALVVQAHDTSYQVTGAVGDAVSVSAEFQVDGTNSSGAYRGVVVAPLTSYGTSATTTAIDNAVSSANGLVANVHFISNTILTTVKVQHSTDNVTFTDLITFTASSTTGGEHKTSTGTVNRYIRANITAASGTRTVAVTAARK